METTREIDIMTDDTDMAEKILSLYNIDDTEINHLQADNILLSILGKLGYEKTIKAFKGLYKWYA